MGTTRWIRVDRSVTRAVAASVSLLLSELRMKQVLIGFLMLLTGACAKPAPVNPIGLGGATAAGGAAGQVGVLSTGGSGTTGGRSGAGGAVVAGSNGVEFPTCNQTMRAPLKVRPSLSGWRKSHKALRRRARPSYSVVATSVFWTPNNPVALDQGTLGSCTGNAVAHCLSTQPFRGNLTEADAVRIYSRATEIDPFKGTYPPTDTGSDGASAWQAAIDLGYATTTGTEIGSLEELQAALQKGPCVLGTNWYSGFFSPSRCGEMSISGTVEGGHEPELAGWDAQLRRFWIRNSWGPDWGVQRGDETGYAYYSAGTLQTLLNQGAEITCPSAPPANNNTTEAP